MDKPQVDAIEGIPPAIAIDQTNPVRTSRSTVGTMTELNDHLKLLFARAAQAPLPRLRQAGAARHAGHRSSTSCRARAATAIRASWSPSRSPVPKNFTEKEIKELLERQGYTRIHAPKGAARGRPGPRHACPRRARARDRGARGGAARRAGPGERLRSGTEPATARSVSASRPTCTAPTATSTTPSRRRPVLVQLAASARARPAAASGA